MIEVILASLDEVLAEIGLPEHLNEQFKQVFLLVFLRKIKEANNGQKNVHE